MAGSFKIPLSDYYTTSSNIKKEVSNLKDAVNDNFLDLVSKHISSLDSRDQASVEAIEAYTTAKTELTTIEDHEDKLSKMASEGEDNPLYSVVTIDNSYSTTFAGIDTGVTSPAVKSAMGIVQGSIESVAQVENFKNNFTSFVISLSSNERTTLANILGIAESTLLDWLTGASHDISSLDDISGLLDTLYTGSGKGISFETLLYSKEIGSAMQSSSFVEKTLTFMMDLPYAIKSQKWAKAISDYTGKATPYLSKVKIVGSIVGRDYITAGGKALKDFFKSDKVKIGGETLAWTMLAMEGGMNVYSKWNSSETDSKSTVGKVVKTAAGATIDTISNVGPLDGMWLGAKAGTAISGGNPIGSVAGAVGGLTLGTANLVGDTFFPSHKDALYGKVKQGAYSIVDKGEEMVENTGKAIKGGWNKVKSIGKNTSEFFQSASENTLSWFGG
ncbi:hypothetical protein AB1395_03895 [Streptococcus pluranimalium]